MIRFHALSALVVSLVIVLARTVQGAPVAVGPVLTLSDGPLVVMQKGVIAQVPSAELWTFLRVCAAPPPPVMQDPFCTVGAKPSTTAPLNDGLWFGGLQGHETLHAAAAGGSLGSTKVLWPFLNPRNGTAKVNMLQAPSPAITPNIVVTPLNTMTVTISNSHDPNQAFAQASADGFGFHMGIAQDGNCTSLVHTDSSPSISASGLWTTVTGGLPIGIYSVCLKILYGAEDKTDWFPLAMPLGHSHHNLHVGIFVSPGEFAASPSNETLEIGSDRLLYASNLTFSFASTLLSGSNSALQFFGLDASLDVCNPLMSPCFTRSDVVVTNATHSQAVCNITADGVNSVGGGYGVLCGSVNANGPWTQLSTNVVPVFRCPFGYYVLARECQRCEETSPGVICHGHGTCGGLERVFPDFTASASFCDCNVGPNCTNDPSVYYGMKCEYALLEFPQPDLIANLSYIGSRVVTFTAPRQDAAETFTIDFNNGTTKVCSLSCTVELPQDPARPPMATRVYNLTLWANHTNGSSTLRTLDANYAILPPTQTATLSNTPSWSTTRTRSTSASRTGTPAPTPTVSLSRSRSLTSTGSLSPSGTCSVSKTASQSSSATTTQSVSNSTRRSDSVEPSETVSPGATPSDANDTASGTASQHATRSTGEDSVSLSTSRTGSYSVSISVTMAASSSEEVSRSSTQPDLRDAKTVTQQSTPSARHSQTVTAATHPGSRSLTVSHTGTSNAAGFVPAECGGQALNASLGSVTVEQVYVLALDGGASDADAVLVPEPRACNVQCLTRNCSLLRTSGVHVPLRFECADGTLRLSQGDLLALATLGTQDRVTCSLSVPTVGPPVVPPVLDPAAPPNTQTPQPSTSPDPGSPSPAPTSVPSVTVHVNITVRAAPVTVDHVWLPAWLPRLIPQPLIVVGYHPLPAVADVIANTSVLDVSVSDGCSTTNGTPVPHSDLAGYAALFDDAGADILPLTVVRLAPGRCLSFRTAVRGSSGVAATTTAVILPPLDPHAPLPPSPASPVTHTLAPDGGREGIGPTPNLADAAADPSLGDMLRDSPVLPRAVFTAVASAGATALAVFAWRARQARRLRRTSAAQTSSQ